MNEGQTPTLLLLINDLMFLSAIRTRAQALGWNVDSIRDVSKLDSLLSEGRRGWTLILIDLDARAKFCFNERTQFLDNIVSSEHIAFYSHMDQDAFQAGRSLGFSQIIPRSKLNDYLEKRLSNP